MTPTVHLVGAGPGAPDLLTLRAARLLGEADIVFHDDLVSPAILDLIKGLKIPVGKRCGKLSTAQQFINKRLADAARRYRTVVRLKGGDPLLFGRADEEIRHLEARGVHVEITPGITAAVAASAQLGVSLTRRGLARSVAFVTPRVGPGEPPSRWADAVAAADTAAIYMGAGEAATIRRELLARGMPASTPAAVVENASLPDGTFAAGTLDELPALVERCGSGPAVLLLGEVLARKMGTYPIFLRAALSNGK